jgi:hypothetical protein
MYPAHITEWATDAYLNEINRLRKDVRPITQQSFAFTDGTEEQDITDNLQRYHLAVGNAWYLKHHITALTFLQRFFFLEQQSVAWQLEKLLCKRPRLSSADEVLEGLPRVFSWSERCPPNCWS